MNRAIITKTIGEYTFINKSNPDETIGPMRKLFLRNKLDSLGFNQCFGLFEMWLQFDD